jgi:glucose/arabinose dehydrogenase
MTVVGGLEEPTTFAFVPDERIFLAERRGVVRVFKDGALLPTPLIDIQDRVNAAGQRGLLGLAVDPDFQTNGYVYLFYTYEHDPSDPDGPKTNQLTRVTVEGEVALPGSEEVILGSVVGSVSQPSCGDFPGGADCLPADNDLHIGGELRFASDGKLFVATGDSADTDDLRVRSQSLDSLAGKMLRINPDGSAPPDNPFFTGDPANNRSKVWAYGLREPFRFGLQPGTDLPFVGDVGSLYSEEISIAYPGANLGWPCYEGLNPPYAIGEHEICRDLLESGPEAVSPPLYTYGTQPAAAVVGGDFALTYPQPYVEAYFFGDFVRSWIAYLTVDDEGTFIGVEHLSIAAVGIVALRTGPDGEIYYLSWTTGELRHLRWISTS